MRLAAEADGVAKQGRRQGGEHEAGPQAGGVGERDDAFGDAHDRRPHERLGRDGVEQHHPLHQGRPAQSENLDVHRRHGVADQDVGRRLAELVEDGLEIVADRPAVARFRTRF